MADAQNNQKNQQQDLNQILKVRREKLAALQEAGKDPFRHVKYDVTAHSKDIVEGFEELEGKTVSIAVLPWSTWPMVPMLQCGFVLSNLALAILKCPP